MNVTTPPPGYRTDSKGRLVPEHLIKPQELLEDQTVDKIIGFAEELNEQISRFRGHTFEDVATYMDLLAEKYGASKGGKKGNVTLTSIDGCKKVTVQVQDFLTFGPELQVAKGLFDACITDWAKNADDNIRALVDYAFQVDKEGRINRAALFGLRRLDIKDDQWRAAVVALNDSIRVVGSREYVRFYKRAHPNDEWQPITIDLASAKMPPTQSEPIV
jgi:hypothetical protein